MSEYKTITEKELNETISQLRGWTQTEAGFCGRPRICWMHPDHRISWDAAPDFSNDMNLAIKLLTEIGSASLEYYKESWAICVTDGTGWNTDNWHQSNPAAIISAVWLSWKNGTREPYEVIVDKSNVTEGSS